MKECRFFNSLADAEREYQRLYKAKTSKRKGYVELNLASSNVGSDKARGTSSGLVDEQTKAKIEPKNGKTKMPKMENLCPTGIRDLIGLIYNEATTALTNTVQAKITAKGIETPLGVLTMGQIGVGEAILKQVYEAIKAGELHKELEALSSQFYTAVPHKLGRTKAHVQAAVISTKAKVSAIEETLQLMRDMLTVDGEEESVLYSDNLGDKFKALGCVIEHVPSSEQKFRDLSNFVLNSRVKRHQSLHIRNIYRVVRTGESFDLEVSGIGGVSSLFHGSRIKNWVGLLTRGTLMPKLVVTNPKQKGGGAHGRITARAN